jgi:hypothetical protein
MFDILNIQNTYTANASYTYINAAILGVNALVSVINFFLFGRRRKNERNFQAEFNLYNTLIIDKTQDILDYFSKQQILVTDLFSSNSMSLGQIHIRDQVEKTCEKLEDNFDNFKNRTSPVLTCFSSSLSSSILEYCDDFSSECTSIITQVCSDSYDLDNLRTQLGQSKSTNLNAITSQIRAYKPE